MNTAPDHPLPEPTGADLPPIARRTVIGAAAWAVPAITLSVAAPATAASAGSTIALTAPSTAFTDEDISSSVIATVRSANGVPLSGESVVFTVDPTSVGAFPNGANTFTAVTDATGAARTVGLSLLSNGTLTVSAMNSGHSDTVSITVAPSDGTIAMTYPNLTVRGGSTFDVPGVVTATHGVVPSAVQLNYSAGITGPASASVNAQTGAFTIPGVTAPDAGADAATITASASNFGTSATTIMAVVGWIITESSTYRAYVGGTPPTNVYAVKGQAFSLTAAPTPAAVAVTYPPNVNAGSTSVATGPSGEFVIPSFTPAAGHSNESGTLTIAAPGFYAAAPVLVNTAQQGGVNGPMWNQSAVFLELKGSDLVTGSEPQPGFAFLPGDVVPLTFTGGFTGPTTCKISAAGTWFFQVTAPASVAQGSVTIRSVQPGNYRYSLTLIAA